MNEIITESCISLTPPPPLSSYLINADNPTFFPRIRITYDDNEGDHLKLTRSFRKGSLLGFYLANRRYLNPHEYMPNFPSNFTLDDISASIVHIINTEKMRESSNENIVVCNHQLRRVLGIQIFLISELNYYISFHIQPPHPSDRNDTCLTLKDFTLETNHDVTLSLKDGDTIKVTDRLLNAVKLLSNGEPCNDPRLILRIINKYYRKHPELIYGLHKNILDLRSNPLGKLFGRNAILVNELQHYLKLQYIIIRKCISSNLNIENNAPQRILKQPSMQSFPVTNRAISVTKIRSNREIQEANMVPQFNGKKRANDTTSSDIKIVKVRVVSEEFHNSHNYRCGVCEFISESEEVMFHHLAKHQTQDTFCEEVQITYDSRINQNSIQVHQQVKENVIDLTRNQEVIDKIMILENIVQYFSN